MSGTDRVSKAVLISAVPPPDTEVSQGILDQFWAWSMQSGLKNSVECVASLLESDFSKDLERFDIPTLLVHGGDDQVVPVGNTMRSAHLIKNCKDVYYPAAPHGLTGDAPGPDQRRRPRLSRDVKGVRT